MAYYKSIGIYPHWYGGKEVIDTYLEIGRPNLALHSSLFGINVKREIGWF